MGDQTRRRKVTEADVLRALEEGLERAPLHFSLTDGQIEYLTALAWQAPTRRQRRWRYTGTSKRQVA